MHLISEAKQGQAWGKWFDYKTFRSVVTVTACGGVHELACHCWTREGYSSFIVSHHGGKSWISIQLNLCLHIVLRENLQGDLSGWKYETLQGENVCFVSVTVINTITKSHLGRKGLIST